MNLGWQKYWRFGSVILLGGILAFILIETVRTQNTGFETKTLWDWMELLIIPLVLAIGAFYLERSERAMERQVADRRAKDDRKIAENRTKVEREIATDRQQEKALQVYLDRMADLLLRDNLRVSEDEEVRNVARIRTLTVLRGLDGTRKGIVLLFLYESGLISQNPVIDLSGANLSGVCLRHSNLSGAFLRQTDLSKADLYVVNLTEANLSEAKLTEADLTGVLLENADLSAAELVKAKLTYADLVGANLIRATLYQAQVTEQQLATAKSLKRVTMPNGTMHD